METVAEIEDSPYSITDKVCVHHSNQEQLQVQLQLQTDASNNNSRTDNGISDIHDSTVNHTTTSPSRGQQQQQQRGARRLHSASLTSAAAGGTTTSTNGIVPRRAGSFSTNNNNVQRTTVVGGGVGGGSTGIARGVPERARSANYGHRNRVIMRSSSSTCATNNISAAGVAGAGAGTTVSSSAVATGRRVPGSRGVSASFSGGLRPLTQGQIVNTPIERKVSNRMSGPGGTLQRTVSDISTSNSFDDTMHSMLSTGGDISLYTMDSINVRKGQQIIAEPLDDKSYLYNGEDDCSFADHESYVTRMTGDNFDTVLESINNRVSVVSTSSSTPSGKGVTVTKNVTDRLHRMGITENVFSNTSTTDDHSMESCLTNDFTDFGFDDDDDDDDDDYDDNDNDGDVHNVVLVDHTADESGDDIIVHTDDDDDDDDDDNHDVSDVE